MSKLTFAEQVKLRNELAVCGWIRNIESKYFTKSVYNHIPSEINNLCIQYYHTTLDRFDPELHHRNIEVTDESMKTTSGGVAMLSNIVETGVHKWKFKIIDRKHYSQNYFIVWKVRDDIDFVDHDGCDLKSMLDFYSFVYDIQAHSIFYGINTNHGELRGAMFDDTTDLDSEDEEYCRSCESGDVVQMILDLNEYELKYCINEEDCGKACDVKKGKYRAVIGMDGRSEIKLEMYESYYDDSI